MERVSDDVWADHLAPLLGQRDLASVAMCCADLRAAMDRVRCRRGIRLRHDQCGMLAQARWAPSLRGLAVRGMARRYVNHRPLPALRLDALLGLTGLQSLHLLHPRFPAGPAWPAVFEACPALRDVTVVADFYMISYAEEVNHFVDLVACGAPRLERLDVEGNWMVITPATVKDWIGTDPLRRDIVAAVKRVCDTPPVASDTLRWYRNASRQVPLGVDAPLRCLEIDDGGLQGMGPRAHSSTETLVWKTYWPEFDARHVAPFSRLTSADIRVGFLAYAQRVSGALASLAHLPPSLRRLTLRFDTWVLRPESSDVAWGAPLAHLDQLTDLDLQLTYPPLTVAELLAGWMGLGGPALRRVRARFLDEASSSLEREVDSLLEHGADEGDDSLELLREAIEAVSRPVDPAGLCAWLRRNPRATARVEGLGDRLECCHPRCVAA